MTSIAANSSLPPADRDLLGEQLRAAEHRLDRLLDTARDYAVFGMDAQRVVTSWSSGARRLFGYTAEEIVGRSGDLLFTPEDRAAGAPEKEAAEARDLRVARHQRWHVRQDGTGVFAADVMSPDFSATGEFVGFVKVARDLTEKRLAEEQAKRTHEELEMRVKQRTTALDVANEELRVANEALRAEMEHRQESEAMRREAILRTEALQEEERSRLSRELHDQLGQECAALMMGLRALERELPEQWRPRLAELAVLADGVGKEVHSLAVELRPTALEDLGLEAALTSYAEMWSKRSGVETEVHTVGLADTRLPRDMELALYRVIQESLTNVMKHAHARLASIVVERHAHELRAVIEDDGRGFDPKTLQPKPRRLGLLGMQERLAPFNGNVAVESARGEGTSVFVRIPL